MYIDGDRFIDSSSTTKDLCMIRVYTSQILE